MLFSTSEILQATIWRFVQMRFYFHKSFINLVVSFNSVAFGRLKSVARLLQLRAAAFQSFIFDLPPTIQPLAVKWS